MVRRNILIISALLFLISALPNIATTQILFDFETPETSTAIEANEAAIVDNPDQIGNESAKCAYYKKAAGNWSFFAFPFENGLNIENTDRVSFKVRTSTSGRIYIKLWSGDNAILESWIREYNYMPEPDMWTELSYDISSIQDQGFTRLEIAVSVDNEEAADVYIDDLEFYNSLAANGEPIINIAEFSQCVEVGVNLILDASESIDIDGSISSFRWDLGDGTIIENADSVSHIYQAPGFYNVELTVTDNDDNVTKEAIRIWVFETGETVSSFFKIDDNYLTNEKVELSFLTKATYINPFDSDTVVINALITQPDGSTRKVPCFYYEGVGNENGSWMTKSSEQNWMLRWSSEQEGTHQIQLEISDKNGLELGSIQEVNLSVGATKGIIRQSANNQQFYQHSTQEMFYPFGINAAWDDIGNYTKIIENLSDGKANLMRYWHAAFTNQALEWRDGLGNYSAIAAAKQDSLIELCKLNDVYLQMCIFHHGMFSQTVDPNWPNSPYNTVNGGMLASPEEFFYNEEAKTSVKKLLRYIVARWGYSSEVFAWELFNEVQWTGNHPNQTDTWKEEVILWHDEMGQYIKEIDPFNHLVTTSAADNQLLDLAGKEGIDIIQYHTYPGEKLVNDLLNKDASFLAETPETSVICGEYGYSSNASVPFDEQRLAIWSSIFSNVPHMMWKWDVHKETEWTDLFLAPANFMEEEGIMEQEERLDWPLTASSNETQYITKGFILGNQNAYALIYDENYGNNISNTTIDLTNLPYGLYTFETIDISTDEVNTEENLEVTFFTDAHELPLFSDALIVKARFQERLQILLAFAGFDAVIGLGQEIALSGMESLKPDSSQLSYEWVIAEKPADSQLDDAVSNDLLTSVLPDVAGEYSFELTIMDVLSEETSSDTINVIVSAPPVAIAGEDIFVELGVRPEINGRESFDPEDDLLTYNWTLVSQPEESAAELKFATLSLPILDPDVVGIYAIELIVSDNFNPSLPDTLLVEVGMSSSIAEVNEFSSGIKVFPNPVSSVLNIQFEESIDQEVLDFTISDMTGKVIGIESRSLNSEKKVQLHVDKLGLKDGMYLMQVASKSTVTTLPFVVYGE